MQRAWTLALGLSLFACGKSEEPVKKEPAAEAKAKAAAQTFGAPITDKSVGVALSDVAAAPEKFKGQPFVATGTVGSVCQHRGCWMTLKDEKGEAFIRMAGHSFLIPKDAAGRKARVMASLAPSDEAEATTCSEGKAGGCKAEAQEQQGDKPLAKLELEASGVELF
jgi:hypothetical protein